MFVCEKYRKICKKLLLSGRNSLEKLLETSSLISGISQEFKYNFLCTECYKKILNKLIMLDFY